ncbi:hypothetical protein niasHT_037193 [Heterodera trifolii]|uniref:Uncharacterized protein n=1 Tax=Heterodera trifolii TaxID=157864 RepID=A0ABD2HTS5_9BILA
MKREKWKHLSGHKEVLFMFHFLEYQQRVSKWLYKWLTQNAVPTEEEAFFIKAFFRYFTEIFVERFTKMSIIYLIQLNVLGYYGTTLLNYLLTNGEMNLVQKLTQIDGMPNLVKYFCQFLGYGLMEDADPSENDIKIELPAEWKKFCKKYMDKNVRAKSLFISEFRAETE